MNKRNTVRLVSFCIAAVAIVSGFLIKSENKVKRYRLEIQANYSKSHNELEEGVNNISLLLKKAEFISSPKEMSKTAAKLLTEAQIAKEALSQLPKNEGELAVINRFLSQVGNYAMTVSKNLVSNVELDEDFSQNISALIDASEKIASAVRASGITYNNSDYWANELDSNLSNTLGDQTLGNSLDELEDSLSDYPTLAYDGPYSDHILQKEPELLKSEDVISVSEAIKTAERLSGTDEAALEYVGELDGKIAAYRFTSPGISVTVTKKGGHALAMRRTRAVSKSIIKYAQALEKAKRYLERIGMDNFAETYYFIDEGVCVINFAFVDGKTICYTDLVKVGVAMDTGDIMLYEASGYISNHKERAFPTPTVSEDEASQKISRKLNIKKVSLALIPTDGGGEVRCYEFLCAASDGQEALVYINASTCAEEDILILLKEDGGILAK